MLSRRQIIQYFLGSTVYGLAELANAVVPPKARLVFIHGRGQGADDPQILKRDWTDAVSKGLAKQNLLLPPELSISYPFYGAELDKFVAQWNGDRPTGVQTRGNAADEHFLSLQADIAENLRINAGVTESQVDAEYGQNAKPKGPQNWEWVLAIIRAIDHANVGITEQAIKNFTRDVYLYLNRRKVRDSINKIVADALTEEPTVIVAHSLGTLVAYDILCNDSRKLNVPLLITVGSPLGINTIKTNFSPLRYPAPVSKWYNAYDVKDVVALRPLDSLNFPVEPGIENYGSVKNWTSNHHSAVGYLDDNEISRHILNALI